MTIFFIYYQQSFCGQGIGFPFFSLPGLLLVEAQPKTRQATISNVNVLLIILFTKQI